MALSLSRRCWFARPGRMPRVRAASLTESAACGKPRHGDVRAAPPGRGSSARIEAPAAERPPARRGGPALRDQLRALRFEVEDLQDAFVRGLVDHRIGQRHEDLVEDTGRVECAENLLSALAREVAHTPVGEQPLVRPSQARRLQHRLDDHVHAPRTKPGAASAALAIAVATTITSRPATLKTGRVGSRRPYEE